MSAKKLSSIMEAYLASAQVPSEPPVKATPSSAPIVPMNKWMLEDKKCLRKTYMFDSIELRNEFMRQLFDVDGADFHAKEIYAVDNTVTIRVCTKVDSALSELDKEFARLVDVIYKDVVCPVVAIYLHNTVG